MLSAAGLEEFWSSGESDIQLWEETEPEAWQRHRGGEQLLENGGKQLSGRCAYTQKSRKEQVGLNNPHPTPLPPT